MKRLVSLCMTVACILPMSVFAQWQLVGSEQQGVVKTAVHADEASVPSSSASSSPQVLTDPTVVTPEIVASANASPPSISSETQASKLYQLDLRPGTLQENIERINEILGNPWELKWLASQDYVVTGHPQVSGKDFYEAVGNLLQYYPVRAIFYKQNHVLAIVPRD